MAYSAKIEIRNAAGAALGAAEKKIAPGAVHKIIARSGQNFTRAHFYSLNSSRANAMGGKRTNFYAKAARATTAKAVTDGAVVSVNHVGVRLRIQGGTIVPKAGKKYLTIPARAEAHGKRAREFNNLTVWRNRAGKPIALVVANASTLKRTKKGLRKTGEVGGGVMYWLVPKVVQKPDPSVMPNLAAMKTAIVQAVQAFVEQRTGSAGGAA